MSPRNVFVLPQSPAPPRKASMPWVAALMPVVMSVTLYVITQSPVTLVLAFLSPVTLALNLIISRKKIARQIVDDAAQFSKEHECFEQDILLAHQVEREQSVKQHSEAFFLGYAPAESAVRVEGGTRSREDQDVLERFSRNPAMPVFVTGQAQTHGQTHAQSPGPQAASLNLSFEGVLARQLTRRAEHRGVRVISGEVPAGATDTAITRLDRKSGMLVTESGESLTLHMEPLRRTNSPAETRVAHLEQRAQNTLNSRATLLAQLGIDGGGKPVEIDLVNDGPHALIAGTTGSGKSELLQTFLWQLALNYTPDCLQFLLIDFKGGTALQHVAELPHTVDMLTDLNHSLVQRTVLGLTSELRRRERLLRKHRAADIADLPETEELARLVVAIDEFATLLTELPELHTVFTDIASRGRALGVHLIIATQRPSGVVRDALAANCTLRLCLRVANAQESHAVLGSDAGARLDPRVIGSCIHLAHGEISPPWRVTKTAVAEVIRLAGKRREMRNANRAWLPPLPAVVNIDDWPPGERGSVFLGLSDLPEQQAQLPVIWRSGSDGPLLILGSRGSGKTNAAELVASQWATQGSSARVRFTAGDAAAVWDQISQLVDQGSPSAQPQHTLWVLDDLDDAFDRMTAEQATHAAMLLGRALRELTPGDGLVLTLSRIPAQLASFMNTALTRVHLRAASKEQHIMWGLPAATFLHDALPGRASFRGETIQVGLSRGISQREKPRVSSLAESMLVAMVSSRTDYWQAMFDAQPDGGEPASGLSRRASVVRLGDYLAQASDLSEALEQPQRVVVIGDGDDWLANALLVAQLRHKAQWVFDQCSGFEIKQITRKSTAPPPITDQRTWLGWHSQFGFRRVSLERHQSP